MIQIQNEEAWAGVVATALKTVNANGSLTTFEKIRWVNAIAKATVRVEDAGAFMTWQAENDTLLIWSDSNEIYEAGGSCQCLAHMNGHPCWHMAAKGLVRNYELALDQIELAQIERRREIDAAPYIKSFTTYKSEKVGSVRI